MNSKALTPNSFDDDTYRILDITLVFLQRYFGHTGAKSCELMKEFFMRFSKRFDEDVIHHELSYRMAATIHYMTFLQGDPNKLGNWMLETGANQPPGEASEYFREHYFGQNILKKSLEEFLSKMNSKPL